MSPCPQPWPQAAGRDCTGPSGALMESTADKGERSAVGQSGVGGGLPASSTLPQIRASWGEGPSAPWGPGQFILTHAAAGSAKLGSQAPRGLGETPESSLAPPSPLRPWSIQPPEPSQNLCLLSTPTLHWQTSLTVFLPPNY